MAVASTDQISVRPGGASVLSLLHDFLRSIVRHSRPDFVHSHSIEDVGSNLTRTTERRVC
ncbi:MAG: hypothetical protein CMM07_19945 [Rhodopirellula sp.]|nr:hypothetical protein [Rhodopirellula sp.]